MAIFQIDQQSRIPIYEQLRRQVLSLAASGVLQKDEQMPSVRQLAAELGINPNTVQKAYRELERECLIYTIPGKGSFISENDAHVQHIREVVEESFTGTIRSAKRSGFSKNDVSEIFNKSLSKEYDGPLLPSEEKLEQKLAEEKLEQKLAEEKLQQERVETRQHRAGNEECLPEKTGKEGAQNIMQSIGGKDCD